MMNLQRAIAEAFEEEADGYVTRESAVTHAIGQAWRDLPPEMKTFLREQAVLAIKELGRDPSGFLWRVLGLTLNLMRTRGIPPAVAVRRAAHSVVRAPGPGSTGKLSQAQVKARKQRILQRAGRKKRGGRGARFESFL